MSELDLHGAAAADPLEGRLARFFTAELRLAEADLRARPIRPLAAVRPRVHLAGLLAASGLVVAGILAFVVIPAVAPRFSATPGTSIPSAPPGSVAPTEPPATPSLPPAGVGDRYPDGIPRFVGGEPVYRPAEAVRRARESGSDASFLAGGWWGELGFRRSCALGVRPLILRVLVCAQGGIADAPMSTSFWPIVEVAGATLPGDGPFVLRIHAHDPLAAECDRSVRARCDEAIVVDQVVWAGDEQTRTEPLTISRVVRQLGPMNPSISVAPSIDASRCIPWPPQTWEMLGEPRISLVAVFPTVADRERAEPQLRRPRGPGCPIYDRFLPASWVVVENAMVLVDGENDILLRTVVHALEGGLQYDDGIPRWIDGEPVFRLTEALGIGAAASDETPFLLGGWYVVYRLPCPARPSGQPTGPLLPWCNGVMVVEARGSGTGTTIVFGEGVHPPPQGPVVLRVHVHDPLARECDPAIRDACERAFVVEAVAWSGGP